MANVISHHSGPLGLPGGPVLNPERPAKVERWNVIKEHAVVKSWLKAKVIEVVGAKSTEGAAESVPEPEAPETQPEPEADDLETLRAEYRDVAGEDPDGRWGEKRLREEIDAKLAE